MDIRLNQKIIKDLCGTVSFKRGDAFYRSGKVEFDKYNSESAEALVKGADEFHVTVSRIGDGKFETKCTCPKLASVKHECQHVAAVLQAILSKQQTPETIKQGEIPVDGIAEGLLTLFTDDPRRTSGRQLHFENRKVLDTEFFITPVEISSNNYMAGLSMKIGPIVVGHIRNFLKSIKEKSPYPLSAFFKYDPKLHCFDSGSDSVVGRLLEIMDDISLLPQGYESSNDTLVIPPSAWYPLLLMLKQAPQVTVDFNGKLTTGIQGTSNEQLPLKFNFIETKSKDYLLDIKGLEQLTIMHAYQMVFCDDKFVQLNAEDCSRLYELKQMLKASNIDQIPIKKDQMGFFVEKVVPGLRRIGEVKINGDITRQFLQTPLIAKLYLDRVNNRLLAGLEFHYEKIVFNPLEIKGPKTGPMLIRDLEKEDLILEIMDESSFAKTDGGYFLHNEELEYEFLYHTLPKLQKLMQVYATTAVRTRIFKGPSKPQIRVKIKKQRTNWLEFKFEMESIPEGQIRSLLEALEEKRKYFRLRDGTLMSLETREFEEIQRFLNAGPIQNEDLEKGLDLPLIRGMQVLDSVEDQDVFMLENSFKDFLAEISSPGIHKFQLPENLASVLRDYQKQGYQWLRTLASYGFGGILADDMGLGKTLQSIAYIASMLPDAKKKKVPMLIVCPSSLTYNWLGEFMKFTPGIEAVIIDGNQKERVNLLSDVSEMDVVITSYMLLRKDIHLYEKMSFHTIFFDEAQAFKNPVTQTAKAVLKLKADHRFALTGTPVENSIEELWSIFRVVFPELFKGLKEYSNLTRKTIARRSRPFLLRRVKEDVLEELPGKIESIDTSELLPEQKKLYAAYLAKLRHKTLRHLDKDTIRKNRIKILSGLTRLRQICCHPALFVDGYQGSSAKFEQLLKITAEARISGRRVLIFSQFTKMLDLIGKELAYQGIPFFYLDGQTPPEERVETCNRFNEGDRDFFLISLKAGGTGLNLTGADTVILYDLWWNPAVEEQAADRAHRMGQQNTVQVIKLIARGTIEEKMNELQDRKRNMIEEIIEEKTSAALTEEDIREILMI
jgi:SNF2 family DNA or RNA helicase